MTALWPWRKRRRGSNARQKSGRRPAAAPIWVRSTEREWYNLKSKVTSGLRWFGQDVDTNPRSPRRASETLTADDHRRVLLSWVAGGPVAQRARRARVSRRTMYAVLERLIYVPDPENLMPYWWDLGLIECFVMPRCLEPGGLDFSQVACLICRGGHLDYEWFNPTLEPGQTFRPDPRLHMAPGNMYYTTQKTQAHLILHFWLNQNPMTVGSFFGEEFDSEVWSRVPQRAMDDVLKYYYTRDQFIVPVSPRRDETEEPWREWRRALFDVERGQSPPPPPDDGLY